MEEIRCRARKEKTEPAGKMRLEEEKEDCSRGKEI